MNTIIRGKLGEDIAAHYLRNKGYKIIERNFKTPFGEVDIIAEKGERLAFVEVKYRTTLAYGQPYEAVNKAKLHKLRQLANYYCQKNSCAKSPCIEVISIAGAGQVRHFTDILM
jgi:putative endonuclease